jgi:hypothetical protein
MKLLRFTYGKEAVWMLVFGLAPLVFGLLTFLFLRLFRLI